MRGLVLHAAAQGPQAAAAAAMGAQFRAHNVQASEYSIAARREEQGEGDNKGCVCGAAGVIGQTNRRPHRHCRGRTLASELAEGSRALPEGATIGRCHWRCLGAGRCRFAGPPAHLSLPHISRSGRLASASTLLNSPTVTR